LRSSGALAVAYGIAVTLTMVITPLLLHAVPIECWRWPVALTVVVTTRSETEHVGRSVGRIERHAEAERHSPGTRM
jgi:hypothetical protein